MKKLLKEPLIHFLLLSLGLFGLYEWVGNKQSDSKTIVVDQAALQEFLQYRSKTFDAALSKQMLAELSEDSFQSTVSDLVREEALYREAKSLGLDSEDYVIRRRLIQKLEFIARGFHEATTNLSGNDLKSYYEKNKNDYYVQPFVTFTHVFFDSDMHGTKKALSLAKKQLSKLNESRVSFSQRRSIWGPFSFSCQLCGADT